MEEDYSYLLLKNETPIKPEEESKKKESKSSLFKKTDEDNFKTSKNTTIKPIKLEIKLEIII
jgi:hypothetical protein